MDVNGVDKPTYTWYKWVAPHCMAVDDNLTKARFWSGGRLWIGRLGNQWPYGCLVASCLFPAMIIITICKWGLLMLVYMMIHNIYIYYNIILLLLLLAYYCFLLLLYYYYTIYIIVHNNYIHIKQHRVACVFSWCLLDHQTIGLGFLGTTTLWSLDNTFVAGARWATLYFGLYNHHQLYPLVI